MRGLLHQPDEARRIARDTDDLQLIAENPHFREIGVVGEELRQRFDDDDARGNLALALLEDAEAGCVHRPAADLEGRAPLGNAARHIVAARLELVA